MSDTKVRIASIGVGMIGLVHAEILSGIEECEFVAIADPDLKIEKTAQDLGTKYYAD